MPPDLRILRKRALLICCDRYGAVVAPPLVTRVEDVAALAAVLRDPAVGGFQIVDTLFNPGRQALMAALERLALHRQRGELALLYFAGLGLLDVAGQPWLAAADAPRLSQSTEGVSAAMLRTLLDLGDANSQLVVIDAVWGGQAGRVDCGTPVPAARLLMSRGRAVWLGADTTAFTYADGSRVVIGACASAPAPFTAALVDALRSGSAAEGLREVSLAALADDVGIRVGRRDRDGALRRTDLAALTLADPALGALRVAANPALPPARRRGRSDVAVLRWRESHGPWWRWSLFRRLLGRRGLLFPPLMLSLALSMTAGTVLLSVNGWSVQRASSQIVATASRRVQQLTAALGLGAAPRFRDRLRDGSPGPPMQRLDGGWFVMGSGELEAERFPFEGPVRAVDIAPFALSQGEISFELYDRFAAATGRLPPSDEGWGRGERPVINVSWEDAADFADGLTEQTGRSCRLPSEAQWEYAARAGRSSAFATGDCITTAEANYNGQRDYDRCGARTGLYRATTLPMTALPPNRWGLYHMHGNVAEWVADCWHEGYQGAPLDGSVWGRADGGDCSRRMVRGGSWRYEPGYLRSAARFWAVSAERSAEIGFRVACDP